MKIRFITAVLAIAIAPQCVLAQQKPTKADAQKVVQIISNDKAKTQQYCELALLNDQIEQADKGGETKKVEQLTDKAYDTAKKLGPEYLKLVAGLQQLNPNSSEAQDIDGVLTALDKLCEKK